MKCKVIKCIAAVAVCAGFASCSNHDFEFMTQEDLTRAKYEAAFIKRFGQPDPSHDWGFSSVYTGTQTRAAFTQKWTDSHSCNWTSKLSFEKPADAVDVTSNADKNNKKNFYVPEGYTGEIGNFNIPDGGTLYNYGTITAINNVNYNGVVTFYNAGTINDFAPSTSGDHDVINIGTLNVTKYSNIGNIYNSGLLVLRGEPEYDYNQPWPFPIKGYKKTTIPDDMTIYSAGEDALVTMPDGVEYFNATIDAHNKVFVEGDLNLQNNDEYRYICALEVTGNLYLNKGALYTSYIEAGSITMNAFPLYLGKGAHVITGNFDIDPSGSYVYGHTNSNALIEAKSFTFKNKNDIVHNFSDNIYFKVSDYIKMDGCFINNDGNYHNYQMPGDLEKLLANTADEYNLVAGRLNEGDYVTGTPACASAWEFGTPPTKDEDTDKKAPAGQWRIIAEDLTVDENGDFDFNDVVFDVAHQDGKTIVILQAAGGTLPLYVAGHEVHEKFGVGTGVMVNTGAGATKDPVSFELDGTIDPVDIDVYVEKVDSDGGVSKIELTATTGRVPQKILVETRYNWCPEYKDIEEIYPDFPGYVSNKGHDWY